MKLRAILHAISVTALILLMSLSSAGSWFANSARWRVAASNHAARLVYLNFLPVLADFDGDRRLDEAQQHSIGADRCIQVRFGDFRVIHLDFGTLPRYSGTLLAIDVNHDNNLDLIWLYRSRSEPAAVWHNDGHGHFGKAIGLRLDDELRGLVFDESQRSALVGDAGCERTALTPDPTKSDAVVPKLDDVILSPIDEVGRNRRRDLDLCLSILRERGPPQSNSVA